MRKDTDLAPPEVRPRPTEPEIRPRPSEPEIRPRPEAEERSAGSVAKQFLENVNIGAGITAGGYLVHETAQKVKQTLSSNEKTPKEK